MHLTAARVAAPTFDRPGATRADAPLDGFRVDTYAAPVGSATEWERGKEGLRAWAAHAGAKLHVVPRDAALIEGETVVVHGPVAAPLHLIIPCRISYVVDEPTRFGFAYVTLPGHPECGEEAFVLSREADEVLFTMRSYSRPAELLARLGGPISRAVQRRTNRAYSVGMRRYLKG